MSTSAKMLKRLLLSTVTLAAIIVTPQIQTNSHVEQNHATVVQTAPTQNQNAVVAVESVGMTVSDMDQAVAFYTRVLSFKKVSDVEVLGEAYEQLQGLFGVRLRVVRMQLGSELIELTEYLTPKGRPIPIDSRSNDRWFQHIAIVVRDMDKAYQHLRRFKVQHTSTAPQRIPDTNKAAAGIRAFYFKDPDGRNLEIIYFPPGKGNPKWQTPTNRLFLGIDHTAIVVSDTATSLKFYRDLLGLKLAGESINYGTEQEHLNNVEGARLQISGLKSPRGPGIEFLEYLEPPGGRPYPPDAQANDLLHWETTLVVADAAAAARQLQLSGVQFISSDVIDLSDTALGFRKGFLVRDPDGHLLRIVER